MNSLQAVIFDMNGTVLEDEGIYTKSFKKILTRIGKSSDVTLTKGISIYKNWQILVNKLNIDDHKTEDLVKLAQEEYKKQINEIKIRKGFFELSEELKKDNIKRALATSNEREITDFVFKHFNLDKYFDAVVTANDVNEVKPNPEIFLLVSGLMSVSPSKSIVIEDAQAGVEAAKRGNFKVIGINGNKLEGADIHVDDFTELSIEKLQSLVS